MAPTRDDGDQVDLDSLRRRGLCCVWALYALYFAAVFSAILASTGGGLVAAPRAAFWDRPVLDQFRFIALRAAANNLPDLLSVALYMKMTRHYMSSSVHPAQAEQEDSVDDLGSINSAVFPAEAWPAPPQLPPPPQQQQDQQQESFAKVMRILRLHAATSLLDVLAAALIFIRARAARLVVAYHVMLALALWLPLYIVKTSFKQMDRMAETFCRLVC